MDQAAKQWPKTLHRWELIVICMVVASLLTLSLIGKGRRVRGAYESFIKQAPLVQAALERFAADHDGRFPPDGKYTNSPPGLDDTYIKWDVMWKIDYDVHPNGKGGMLVCLEFCGPYKDRRYLGLCRNPEYRRKYGRGQPIPGKANRIWLIREQAPIMPEPKKGSP